jgi:hypothetical protein
VDAIHRYGWIGFAWDGDAIHGWRDLQTYRVLLRSSDKRSLRTSFLGVLCYFARWLTA